MESDAEDVNRLKVEIENAYQNIENLKKKLQEIEKELDETKISNALALSEKETEIGELHERINSNNDNIVTEESAQENTLEAQSKLDDLERKRKKENEESDKKMKEVVKAKTDVESRLHLEICKNKLRQLERR